MKKPLLFILGLFSLAVIVLQTSAYSEDRELELMRQQLKKIESNQELILNKLEDMTEQMRILKIRISSR